MANAFDGVQKLGRALMLPIAVLPVAGLLLRLGQPDMLDIGVLAAAGDAIFANLGMLFAVGVAVGLARENHGAAGLAGLVGFLVATKGAEVLLAVPPQLTANLAPAAADVARTAYRTQQLAKLSMPVGILSGLIAGGAYNRFSEVALPSYLAFFGGRRFVPIVTGFIGILVAIAFGFGWPSLSRGMDSLSQGVLASGSWGLFAYGVLNRALIVTGLHHIINNLAWFLLGDFHGVTGDLKRFAAGDPTAGAFMSGFFPVMMFGLPGACLAMYRAALPARRQAVAGLLLSLALTSFLTGITEPIEFTFMFLAPLLYAVHAVLTGISMALMDYLGVHLGFGFSAGLFDYITYFKRATHPLWLLPIGLAYFGIYYGLFRYGIARFNLATPGREREVPGSTTEVDTRGLARGAAFVAALGGAANLTSVDACTTRLRLVLADGNALDTAALTKLGARGVVRPSANVVQVVLGPVADQVAGEIRRELRLPAATAALPAEGPAQPELAALPTEPLLAGIGGRGNLRRVEAGAGRLLLTLADPARVDRDALARLGVRGVALPAGGSVQLLVGAAAAATGRALETALRAAAG